MATETHAELFTMLKARDKEIARLRGVLREISEGKGRFTTDHYQHAMNTIEDMKELATDALAGKS